MGAFDQPELVEFFSTHRQRSEDLYPSEARFLPSLAKHASRVLDVGCAAGGFMNIWRAYNAEVGYTGVDVSEPLVAAARRLHPDAEFLVGDSATGLQLPDRVADVVQALGWLHWEPRYPAALIELWRLTDSALFFDVRMHDSPEDVTGVQHIAGGGTTPYICVSWPRFAQLLLDLEPSSIRGYGYMGAPGNGVTGMPDELCLATFVLERGEGPPSISVELPFEWPIP